jgi:hypothetical protein
MIQWQGLAGTLRQVWELISGPYIAAKTTLLPFNRVHSRVVTDLITSHNTLRRRLHIIGLTDSPLCRKCGAEEETSVHVLCECEALATLGHIYLGSFFLDPEDITGLSLGVIWNFLKRVRLSWLGHHEEAQTACQRPKCIATIRAWPIFINSLIQITPAGRLAQHSSSSSSSSSSSGPISRCPTCTSAYGLLCSPKHSIQHRFNSPVPLIKRQRSLTEAVLISFGSANSFPKTL